MYIYISLQFAQIIFVCYNGEKHATKSPWSERTLFDTSLCTPSKGYFEYGLIRMPFLKIKSVRKPIFVCCKTCRHGKHGTKTLSLRVHCSVRYQSVYATHQMFYIYVWNLNMDIHQFAVCSLHKLFLFAIMEETMQRKPRGLSVHCLVPVCVRHPLVRRQALGTGRDPAARFSFLLSSGNSSLLPSQTDLGSPWSSPVWDRGAVSLPAIVAGGRRWKQVATYFFAFLHPLRRPTWGLRLAKQLLTLCKYKKGIKHLFMTKMNEKINIRPTWALRLAKQLLSLCRYKKGIKPLFMTKMNEKINIRSTWALRLAKQLLTDVTEWTKVQTKKQGNWITF